MTSVEDLQKIIHETSWIRVKRYNPPEGSSAEDRLRLFESHHERETRFLIEKCRQLAQELLDRGCG